MAAPVPLQSFLGGITLPLPVHLLMLLNGNVFGISGFIHRTASGKSAEALTAVAGLILGGMVVGLTEGSNPQTDDISLPIFVTSGLLVGLGTKLADGCTSGHMVCGLARFSPRSIVATAIFFMTGVITSHMAHRTLGPTAPPNWSLGIPAKKLLSAQLIPFTASVLLYTFATSREVKEANANEPIAPVQGENSAMLGTTTPKPRSFLRHLALITTTTQFALALQLSGLTSPSRVIRFLLLPFSDAFDPSLAFLAMGTLPLAALLYHFARGKEVPRLGGLWDIPKRKEVTARLVTGSAIFGVGWGLAGICPGPGLVNLGRALVNNDGQLAATALWLVAVSVGGLLV